jgi:hypothetical protein
MVVGVMNSFLFPNEIGGFAPSLKKYLGNKKCNIDTNELMVQW